MIESAPKSEFMFPVTLEPPDTSHPLNSTDNSLSPAEVTRNRSHGARRYLVSLGIVPTAIFRASRTVFGSVLIAVD